MCAGRRSFRDLYAEVDDAASDASHGVEKAASEVEGASRSSGSWRELSAEVDTAASDASRGVEKAVEVDSASEVWADMKAGESQ